MLHTMFDWLEGYKDQLGLLIQGFLFIATLILIRVGWRQAKAADAQAKAAEAQVAAASEQARTARTQLNMSLKEMFANLSAADAASRPMLHVVPKPNCEDEFLGESIVCEIENCGHGLALEIEAFYGSDPDEAAGMYGNSLGIGEKTHATFNNERVKRDGLTLHYKSTHGSTYSTSLSYLAVFNEFCELHTRVKNAFGEMVDLIF